MSRNDFNQWFVLEDGEYRGPITDQEMRELAKINPKKTLFWRDGMAKWESLSEHPWRLSHFEIIEKPKPIDPAPQKEIPKKKSWSWIIAPVILTGALLTQALSFSPELSVRQNIDAATITLLPRILFGTQAKVFKVNQNRIILVSNLPKGHPLRLDWVGRPETLVGVFRFAKGQDFEMSSNGWLPIDLKGPYPGEYKVEINCFGCTLPLGEFEISVKDIDYSKRLREYHDVLNGKAREELSELAQLAETLEAQLAETNREFEDQLAQVNLVAWRQFSDQWLSLQRQLDLLSSEWSSDRIVDSYFYSNQFSTLRETGLLILNTHEMQSRYLFTGEKDESLLVTISENASLAQTSLASVRLRSAFFARQAIKPGEFPVHDEIPRASR